MHYDTPSRIGLIRSIISMIPYEKVTYHIIKSLEIPVTEQVFTGNTPPHIY